jgi:hypothetical protein
MTVGANLDVAVGQPARSVGAASVAPGLTATQIKSGRGGNIVGSARAESFQSNWKEMVAQFGGESEERTIVPGEAEQRPSTDRSDRRDSQPEVGNSPEVEKGTDAPVELGASPGAQSNAAIKRISYELTGNDVADLKLPASSEDVSAPTNPVRAKVEERPAAAKPAQAIAESISVATAAVLPISVELPALQPAAKTATNSNTHPVALRATNENAKAQASAGIEPGRERGPVNGSGDFTNRGAGDVSDAGDSVVKAAGPAPDGTQFDSGTSHKAVEQDKTQSDAAKQVAGTEQAPAAADDRTDAAREGLNAATLNTNTTFDANIGTLNPRSHLVVDAAQIAGASVARGVSSASVVREKEQLSSLATHGVGPGQNGLQVVTVDDRSAGSSQTLITARMGTPAMGPGHSAVETFSALDGEPGSLKATWVHAGPRQAEAGFEDPALGWVSVRAGLSGGGISAVVVPDSAAATQALGMHMAGLHDYLAQQHSSVDTLTLGTAQHSGADAGMNQQSQQQGGHEPRAGHVSAGTDDAQTVRSSTKTVAASNGEGWSDAAALSHNQEGRYISVMA